MAIGDLVRAVFGVVGVGAIFAAAFMCVALCVAIDAARFGPHVVGEVDKGEW